MSSSSSDTVLGIGLIYDIVLCLRTMGVSMDTPYATGGLHLIMYSLDRNLAETSM